MEDKTDNIPSELFWIKEMADAGLKINGRKQHVEDNEKQPKNSTTIGEIIKSTKFKYNKSYHKLYFIRFLGETLGSAMWVKRDDLDPASLILKSFEREEKAKKGNFMEYILDYNGFTAKKHERCKFNNKYISEPELYKKMKYENNEEIHVNKNNMEQKKKGRGRKRIYAENSKNRKLDLNCSKREIRNEGSCIFDSIKFFCPNIPAKNSELFLYKKTRSWKGVKNIIISLFNKYNENFKCDIILELAKCDGKLIDFIGNYLDEKNGKYLIIYRINNSLSGHCGVIVNGIFPAFAKMENKFKKKCEDKIIKFEEQSIIKEDLNRAICEVYVIRISDKENKEIKEIITIPSIC